MIDQNYMKALIVILFCFHHTFAQQNEQYQILVSKASLSHYKRTSRARLRNTNRHSPFKLRMHYPHTKPPVPIR